MKKEREGEKKRQRGIEREKGRKKDREINMLIGGSTHSHSLFDAL